MCLYAGQQGSGGSKKRSFGPVSNRSQTGIVSALIFEALEVSHGLAFCPTDCVSLTWEACV